AGQRDRPHAPAGAPVPQALRPGAWPGARPVARPRGVPEGAAVKDPLGAVLHVIAPDTAVAAITNRVSSEVQAMPCVQLIDNAASRYPFGPGSGRIDRKSTRLNSSHSQISYAVFC